MEELSFRTMKKSKERGDKHAESEATITRRPVEAT